MNKHIVLKQRQSLPLESKIELSKKRIREWLDHCDGDAYVAFSGGKDSSVLLHLVWSIDPTIPAVFSDTGLEMPEIRAFVKSVSTHGLIGIDTNLCGPVERVRPVKNFKRVIEEDGFALPSKKLAKTLRILKEEKDNPNWANTYCLYDTGIKQDGTFPR
jgi:3'-phosphoadenosine 5'-phosphosulfate sulfotransferase (PAPS reductase)/FAD synthetase